MLSLLAEFVRIQTIVTRHPISDEIGYPDRACFISSTY